jgi:hypothetical protein
MLTLGEAKARVRAMQEERAREGQIGPERWLWEHTVGHEGIEAWLRDLRFGRATMADGAPADRAAIRRGVRATRALIKREIGVRATWGLVAARHHKMQVAKDAPC